MKIHIGADNKLSTTLYRKPTNCATILHFHSIYSLKYKASIFSQALRYNLLIADDNILEKELDSLTISLLARKYSLEVITRNISKALLSSCDILLYRTLEVSSSRSVLPVLTPYSSEGRQFSKLVRDHWHIIENNQRLHSIWPNPPTTAYHKTKSLKDMLGHSCQTKPRFLSSATNKHHQ